MTLVLMPFQRQSRLHPALLTLSVVDNIGVSHRRQFTGGVI